MQSLKSYIFLFIAIIALSVSAQQKSLAESLGYSKDARVFIINADDFGMCHAENVGTQKVLEYGVISSATMLMPCPWVQEAMDYVKANNLNNIGIHVAFTSEWKRYRWPSITHSPTKGVNSLLDAQGYMWHESDEVEKYADIEDMKREVRKQIQNALDQGIDVSHFDSHMGSFYGIYTGRIEFLALALAISYEYGLPYRMPYIPFLMDPFREKGHAILDYLSPGSIQPSDPAKRKEFFLGLIKNLPPGVTEVYVHPAISDEELQNITNSHRVRQSDVDVFTDPEIKQALQDNNIHVINFQPLRKWQREQMNWHSGFKAEDVYEEYKSILQARAKMFPQWQQYFLPHRNCCPK